MEVKGHWTKYSWHLDNNKNSKVKEFLSKEEAEEYFKDDDSEED